MKLQKPFYQVVCFIQLSEAGVLSVSLKIDNIEYRAVIKIYVKEGLTPYEIHSKFINVYGDSSPLFSKIKKWVAEFKRGRTSLEDDPREGRSRNATTPESIKHVHDMVLEGCFAYLTKNHYRDGVVALEHRWNKCITRNGDCVEK
jgi:hypothetical protein